MTDETNTTSKVEVTIKVRDEATGEMVSVLCTSAKLIKTDAGENQNAKVEETFYISITPGTLPKYADAVISVNGTSKLTKADAG
jgi:hypothetical protein